jgi:hypothetical protein
MRARVLAAAILRSDVLDVAIVTAVGDEDAARSAATAVSACRKCGLLPLNVSLPEEPTLPLVTHANWRYLLALDGQSYSYRLASLLPLRAAVLKADSRHAEFYYSALRRYEHYIPFACEEGIGAPCVAAAAAVEWVLRHDALARRIADSGAAFAQRHLAGTGRGSGRACYWAAILREYASLVEPDAVGNEQDEEWVEVTLAGLQELLLKR